VSEVRTTRRGTLLAPKAPSPEQQAEQARQIMDRLEGAMARARPTLEAIGATLAASLEELERAYGPRPR
jgi:hypothetical protein